MDLSTLYGADLEFRDLNKTDVYLCPQVAPTEREKKRANRGYESTPVLVRVLYWNRNNRMYDTYFRIYYIL